CWMIICRACAAWPIPCRKRCVLRQASVGFTRGQAGCTAGLGGRCRIGDDLGRALCPSLGRSREQCSGGHPNYLMTSILTFSRPAEVSPILAKAERERSITRPRTNGPRSLMRTTTLLPFRTLVTLTCEPNGSVRCAAVFWRAL